MTTPRLLSNRYELGDTLGYGGMSEVHKGRDVRLGRDVAIKVLRADLARDPQFQERFRREAQNAAALNHPAIVAVYDTGETRNENGPLPYIVMEYVDGRTLRDIVKSEGPLSAKRAMEIMADVCAALDFSHRHGIVHRDVKPANAMITKTGAVKVMDFGIARAVSDGQAAVTQTAAVIGTAQYLSPEQARGEAVDARSDVYAAGCVLFELLTGEPPFTGDSPVAVAYQHVREDPKSPSALNPRVPQSLDAIVLKAMAKGPANRYQSAAEMRGDLVRVLSGQRPAAPMVMTAEDRTSIMGAGRATEVMGGRHRPGAMADDYDDYDAEDERARRRRKGLIVAGWIVGAIAVIVLAAMLLPALFGPSANPNAGKVAVPNVVGQQLAQATQMLNQQNLTPVTKPVVCQAGPDGTAPCTADQIDKIIRTDPGAGSYLAPGTTVTLYVGTAPAPVQVPDLTGMSPADAQTALAKVGLTLAPNPQTTPTPDSTKVGKVASQSPTPQSMLKPGSSVSITVYTLQQTVPLPDVRNSTFDQAKSTLEGQGFKVRQKTVPGQQAQGTVVDMNPAANSMVQPGATITLSVSDGSQASISAPTLINLTQAQAQQALGQQGWTGQFQITTIPTFDKKKDSTIADQNPQPGQPLQKNAPVGIVVYQFGPPTGPTT